MPSSATVWKVSFSGSPLSDSIGAGYGAYSNSIPLYRPPELVLVRTGADRASRFEDDVVRAEMVGFLDFTKTTTLGVVMSDDPVIKIWRVAYSVAGPKAELVWTSHNHAEYHSDTQHRTELVAARSCAEVMSKQSYTSVELVGTLHRSQVEEVLDAK